MSTTRCCGGDWQSGQCPVCGIIFTTSPIAHHHGTPAEEIALLNDKIKELEAELTANRADYMQRLEFTTRDLDKIAELENRLNEMIVRAVTNLDKGAREMAEIIYRDIYNLSSGDYQSHVEAKLQLWRERKNK